MVDATDNVYRLTNAMQAVLREEFEAGKYSVGHAMAACVMLMVNIVLDADPDVPKLRVETGKMLERMIEERQERLAGMTRQ